MTRVKMTPFTYQGLKVKVLIDVHKPAPFDNELFIKAGEIVEVVNTIKDRHLVKTSNGLRVTVKISDTEIAY